MVDVVVSDVEVSEGMYFVHPVLGARDGFRVVGVWSAGGYVRHLANDKYIGISVR